MLDFVFCTDKNYLKGYGVLMLSILRFASPKTEKLCFHVLSDELDEADKATLQGIAARRENTEVAFYSPARLLSAQTIESINDCLDAHRTHVTATAFYRILATDILPHDVHRALYIDGDIVCTGSLEELFTFDLKGCPIGMCLERENAHISVFNRLDYPPQDGYFNSGVILFDLCLWRKEKLTQKLLDYLKANAKRLFWHDQDLINACLHGRIAHLNFSYNIMITCLYVFYWIEEEKNNYFARQTQYLPKALWPALRAAVESPRLVHFWGIKPWYRECDNPFAPVWRYFCAASPWKDERLKRYSATLPAKTRIKRLGRRALEKMRIVAKSSIPYPEEAYAVAQRVLEELREGSLE